ncbi:MAG: biotin/lipoyl-containing protein [Deltaproteobacteria bacterium]
MLHQIILPRLGTNIEDGRLVEWRKKEGEPVARGEVLLLVETSKAIFEVEAENDGFLRKVISPEGGQVRFTEPVGIVSDKIDEDIDAWLAANGSAATAPARIKYHEEKRAALVKRGAGDGALPLKKCAATPAARRLAAEANVDLGRVSEAYGTQLVEEKHVRAFVLRKRVAIYGAGLGAKQAMELIKSGTEYDAIGLFDDNLGIKGAQVAGLKVLGGWDDFLESVDDGTIDGIAISLHSEHRRRLMEKIKGAAPELEHVALVDSRAVVASSVVVSQGAFIEAGSVIGPETYIGEGVIVDNGAVVSHDCHIGAHSHLSPGCSLSGIVRLEGNVLVGVGACINSQVNVGMNVVITPGSAVVSDIPADSVVSGNPARIIGRSLRGA